jgi:modulator of FtsH protease HflK
MKADYLAYKRATERALLGLALQLVLGVALLIYAILGKDHAAFTAALFVLLGLVVWLSLAIVFDQHRRERIEAMEAESFAASDAAASSVFEEGAAELRLAAKRLKSLYRWFVPGVSVFIGAALILLGLWRARTGSAFLDPDPFVEPILPRGWPIGLGVLAAFTGFVYARYVSGMAKQPVWANLRAGAAWAAGTALAGLAMVVGQFVDVAGPDVVLRYLQVIIPVAMIVLGVETFLNFILDLYRPRLPGALPRPAFDSRLLGFVAAPDRIAKSISEAINYQVGFDVTSSWFYQLLSRSIVLLVIVAVVILWGLSSLAVVRPHQRGMLTRFGRVINADLGPGLHFKLPWPIERVEIPLYEKKDLKGKVIARSRTTTGLRTLEAGTPAPKEGNDAILWTTEHATDESYFIVRPGGLTAQTAAAVADDDGAKAPEYGVVAVEVPLHFAVRDVEAFEKLAVPDQREWLLLGVARREVSRYVSTLTVDEVLDTDRAEMATELRRRIEKAFADINPKKNGQPVVEIISVGVSGVHPPRQVAFKFEQVIEARQKFEARVESARATANTALIEVVGSRGLADQIIGELNRLDDLKGQTGLEPAERERRLTEQEVVIERLLESAGGKAAAELAQASADRWTKHMGARAQAERYLGQVASYKAAPEYYRAALYFEALRDALANTRIFVTSDDVPLRLRVDMQDRITGADMFGQAIKPPEENH